MPELPEVETIMRRLRTGNGAVPLPGRQILALSAAWPRHFSQPSLKTFRRHIHGREITDVRRRGKYLIFPLDRRTMLIHLRMSGDLRVEPQSAPRGPYDHTVFQLDTGWELRFSDARKFGRVHLLDDPGRILARLGPEPLASGFTPQHLRERIRRHRRQIKPLLMDQRFLAGMGNIYTDEALHRAHIHPRRRSDTLSDEEITALWHGIRGALQDGIVHAGASIDWVYRGGDFQNLFRVYRRAGETCATCGSIIQRIVVGQRGTYLCPNCQPEDKR